MRKLVWNGINRLRNTFSATCPILLYHSVSGSLSPDLKQDIHNVTPESFSAHVEWLTQNFRLVQLDDLLALDQWDGLAAITFDDGYASVFSEALPILRQFSAPATVFLNVGTMPRRPFWRDRIRYIINNGLEDEFSTFLNGFDRPPDSSLYRYSKLPTNDSCRFASRVEEFLHAKGVSQQLTDFCVSEVRDLTLDPLLKFGNHTQNHYVLSSLAASDQRREIIATHDSLLHVPTKHLSKVFSVPFGGMEHFNTDTLDVVRELGYEGIVLSRSRLARRRTRQDGLVWIDRFMPQDGDLKSQISVLR